MKSKSFFSPAKIFLGLAFLGLIGLGTWLWHSSIPKPSADPKALVAQYQMLSDSMDNMNMRAKEDSTPDKIKLFNDQQRFLQTQIESLQRKIDTASASNGALSPADRIRSMQADSRFVLMSVGAVALLLLFTIMGVWLSRRKAPKKTKPKPTASSATIPWDEILQKHPPPAEAPSVLNHQASPQPTATPDPAPAESWKTLMLAEMEEEAPQIPSNPQAPMAQESPSSPLAATSNPNSSQDDIKAEVVKLSRRGFSAAEIARHLKISQDKVEFILRIHNPS